MPFPTQTAVEVPLLKVLKELGGEAKPREVYPLVAAHFPELTPEDLQALMAGGAVRWWNHVQWARQRLVRDGQIDGAIHGLWRITDAGRARLLAVDQGLTTRPAPARARPNPTESAEGDETQSPTALIEAAHEQLEEALSAELLQVLANCSPEFFERLVVDLLVKMGYGGSRLDAGQRLGRSGDGGIDGIIKEDRLGLGVIYLQAKRWAGNSTVGSPEVQAFAGALQGQRAQKGVFITTATFTRSARAFVEALPLKIVLIDGSELARLMIDYGVGTATVATYEIKRIDSDYFSED